jgi:diguanylate cyclase (GGDEF)-like protein
VKTTRPPPLYRLLDWTDFAKAQLVAVLALSIEAGTALWIEMALYHSDTGPIYLNERYARLFQALHLFNLGVWLITLAMSLALRRVKPAHTPYVHFVITYFVGSMLVSAWFVGLFSFLNGVILVGASLLSVILFKTRLVIWVVITALAVYTLAGALTLGGHIPYAPFFNILPVSRDGLWHLNLVPDFAGAILYTLVLFAMTLVLVQRWRDREAEILRMAVTDELTGLANRRAIIDFLRQELSRQRRHQNPLTLVIVDLDHFKSINDTHGHDMGDLVLQLAARSLAAAVRDTDRVGRYGGEEFVIVLPDTDAGNAALVVERCRQNLAALAITADNHTAVAVSGSFGITESTADGDEGKVHTLLARADQALYRAKANGRNRAEHWHPADKHAD